MNHSGKSFYLYLEIIRFISILNRDMKNIKKASICALFLLLLCADWGQADVKLRIYLRDGTLQAGNLVTITEDTFVILGRAGRITVPKNQIMFINGKTLKQWENQPDKYFQTEIIPSKIPDPNYVNSQAQLPPPPAIQPVAPLAVTNNKPEASAVAPPKTESTGETKSAEAMKPAVAAPPPEPVKPPEAAAKTLTPMVVPAKTEGAQKLAEQKEPIPVKSVKKRDRKKKMEAPAMEAKANPAETVSDQKLPPFSRDAYAIIHYQRAKAFISQGAIGEAIQELHYTCILDRRDVDAALLLSRLYMDEGVYGKSRRILEHPGLKKSQAKADLLAEMDLMAKSQKQGKWILYGGAAGGVLMIFPLLALGRRFRRLPKPAEFLDAETLAQSPFVKMAQPTGPAPEPQAIEEPVVETPVLEVAPKPDFPFALHEPQAMPPPQVSMSQAGGALERNPPESIKPEEQKPVRPVEEVGAKAPRPQEKPMEVPPLIEARPPVPPQIPVTASNPPREEVTVSPQVPATPAEAQTQGLSRADERELFLKTAAKADAAISEGNHLAHTQKFDLARRQYRTALALNPSSYEAYIGLGFVSFMQGQWELALEHYAKAATLNPSGADAHYGIGRVLLEAKRVDEAVPELRKTLDLDPTFDDARETLTLLGRAS